MHPRWYYYFLHSHDTNAKQRTFSFRHKLPTLNHISQLTSHGPFQCSPICAISNVIPVPRGVRLLLYPPALSVRSARFHSVDSTQLNSEVYHFSFCSLTSPHDIVSFFISLSVYTYSDPPVSISLCFLSLKFLVFSLLNRKSAAGFSLSLLYTTCVFYRTRVGVCAFVCLYDT